jgi:hypothetical protein
VSTINIKETNLLFPPISFTPFAEVVITITTSRVTRFLFKVQVLEVELYLEGVEPDTGERE